MGFVAFLLCSILGEPFRMDLLYNFACISFQAADFSRAALFSYLFTSALGGVVVAKVVERSRQSLDFVATAWIIHLNTCLLSYGAARYLSFVIVIVVGMVIMAGVSIVLIQERELTAIPVGQGKHCR